MKDILLLERVQRRATKFILNNYTMDYKTRLTNLKLLPLMYVLELQDVIFLIKSLNIPQIGSMYLPMFVLIIAIPDLPAESYAIETLTMLL